MRVAFLDRDGVVNWTSREGAYVTRASEMRLVPGAAETIACLNRAGYTVMIVTNQRCVALGLMTPADLDGLHAELSRRLAAHGGRIARYYVCPHDIGTCSCRKPQPGLFIAALSDHPEIELDRSFFVGDSATDAEAAIRIGIRFIAVSSNGDLKRALTAAGVLPG